MMVVGPSSIPVIKTNTCMKWARCLPKKHQSANWLRTNEGRKLHGEIPSMAHNDHYCAKPWAKKLKPSNELSSVEGPPNGGGGVKIFSATTSTTDTGLDQPNCITGTDFISYPTHQSDTHTPAS
uniref:Uncharacterized protein n=1 Tax=Octopus bimaculoides TaxID=37653 RepID=A0A0L8GF34_OCTBM